jgi:hypothetical protein
MISVRKTTLSKATRHTISSDTIPAPWLQHLAVLLFIAPHHR